MSKKVSLQGHPDYDKYEIVKTGVSTISSNGSPTNWQTIPHNLGYRPIPIVELNGVSLSGIFTNGDIPLPTFSGASVDQTNHVVTMQTWIFAAVDADNLYVVFLDGNATAKSFNLRYDLLRRKSA